MNRLLPNSPKLLEKQCSRLDERTANISQIINTLCV